jgi:SAM-dependent methyltransferase
VARAEAIGVPGREPRRPTWERALEAWPRTRPHRLLRAYGDAVNRALLERWLPDKRLRTVLKTDLFDEAVGEGLLPLLGETADRIEAIEISRAVLAAARSRHPQLEGHLADIRKLPFEDGRFELVVSNSTLDHLDSLQQVAGALRELHRVLEPDGTLLVTIDNRANPLVALRTALPFTLLNRLRIVPHYVGAPCGPRTMRRLLREAGFHVEREGAIMHVPRVLVLALATVLPHDVLLRWLVACERLEALPTRYLTGQFVAARASRR